VQLARKTFIIPSAPNYGFDIPCSLFNIWHQIRLLDNLMTVAYSNSVGFWIC